MTNLRHCSLWSHLSGDSRANLASNGANFLLQDDFDDTRGEVWADVNFFSPGAQTSAFAKLDVAFGDDLDGIGGKVGVRYN